MTTLPIHHSLRPCRGGGACSKARQVASGEGGWLQAYLFVLRAIHMHACYHVVYLQICPPIVLQVQEAHGLKHLQAR